MQIGMFLNDVLINSWCVFVKAFKILTRGALAWLIIMNRVRVPISIFHFMHHTVYIKHMIDIHE